MSPEFTADDAEGLIEIAQVAHERVGGEALSRAEYEAIVKGVLGRVARIFKEHNSLSYLT